MRKYGVCGDLKPENNNNIHRNTKTKLKNANGIISRAISHYIMFLGEQFDGSSAIAVDR